MSAGMVLVLVSGVAAQAASDDELAPLIAVPAGAEVVKDRNIVMLKKGAPAAARSDLVGLARARGGAIRHQYSAALNGFSATLSAAALTDLRQDADVVRVEPVLVGHGDGDQTQNLPWGLDRIDQTSAAPDKHYRYPATGHGVRVYVIDSGVNRSHEDFGGRVVAGPDYVDDDAEPEDCYGHGTHVAGTVAGARSGVAKEATVVAIRVMWCDTNVSSDDDIAAIDWVAANHPAGTPGVLNRSIGYDSRVLTLEDAVDRVIRDHNVVAVAPAGNTDTNACSRSPGWMPAVLTVGASDSGDKRWSHSNWGGCLDLFAPGVDVRSADYDDNAGYVLMEGTSMAAPHVAGAAALYLQSNRTATVAQVHAALVDASTKGKVEDEDGSPDRLLFNVPQNTAPQSSLNSMFTNYGNNAGCADWSGADGTQSVALPSGKRAWFFADTFLNRPAERAGFFRSALRNSIVVQNGSSLRTITGGNTCQERNDDIDFWSRYARTPFAETTPDPSAFYWRATRWSSDRTS